MNKRLSERGRPVTRPARFLESLMLRLRVHLAPTAALFAALTILGLSVSGAVAEPWLAPGWSCRAVVSVESAGSAGVDVAAVRIIHAGLASRSGDDYRVFDAQGAPVPYQITAHDPARDSLISFRCASPGSVFTIYFGKADAPADPLRAVTDPAPGKGPPTAGPGADGWIPKAGLVLTTMRRDPAAANPETINQMTQLIATSPGLDGSGYRANISDGMNPFGDSDNYISVYRGWLKIPAAGQYGFCTASNEASFSFLDGKDLVNWPGRHTEERGKYGQKNVELRLEAGLHYVEYLQEEALLFQMAFLGYKPPGGGAYVGIPNDCFPQPHRGYVRLYEQADAQGANVHPTVMPRIELVSSRWPPARKEGQHTLYQFIADAGTAMTNAGKDAPVNSPSALAAWKFSWTFGDGLSAEGARVEHLYLKLGSYTVTMTATDPAGRQVSRTWPLRVFQIDHIARSFKNGQAAPYVAIAKGYDIGKLATPSLAELARLADEAGERELVKTAANQATTRSDITPDDLADMHLLLATSAALGKSSISGSAMTADEARQVVAHLKAAIEKESDPIERVKAYARLIRVVGIDVGDAETAQGLYNQAKDEATKAGIRRKMQAAFREATIAIGDARLYARQIEQASEDYKTAEALAESPMSPQVKVSKVGAFPEAIEQALERHRVEDAMRIAQSWRYEVPSDQIRGTVLFYLAKIERLQGRPAATIKPMRLAIDLAQGAEFEAEARWTLAQAYRDLGDIDAYTRTLKGLVKSGLSGTYRDQAIKALAENNVPTNAGGKP